MSAGAVLAIEAPAWAAPVITCKSARYSSSPTVMAAAAKQHADDPERLRAVRVCELSDDCNVLLDLVSCVTQPLMCDPCDVPVPDPVGPAVGLR